MDKDFAGNGEKGYTSVIAADQLVTFSLPEWQYDSACPVLGEIFRVPDLIDDVFSTSADGKMMMFFVRVLWAK